MAVGLKWRGPQFNKALKVRVSGNIRQAGAFLTVAAKKEVSTPNPGIRRRRKRNTSHGSKGSSYTEYTSPSQVGEPPRVRTGHGRSQIIHEHDKDKRASRVGVRQNGMYMFWLELRGRPWLGMQGALGKNFPTIRRLASVGTGRPLNG